jgi:hypothetical protein
MQPDCTERPPTPLVTAATVLEKGFVSVIESGGLQAQRALTLHMIDTAGRAIGKELRRRQ